MKCVPSLFFSFLLVSPLSAHVWTGSSGKKVEADFLRIDDGKVVLKRKSDGKQFTVEKSFFSEKDQAVIDGLIAKHEQGGENKKPTALSVEVDALEENLNFGEPWPKIISLKKDFDIVEVENEEGLFIYHSKNFEFIADVRLSKSVVKRFGELFEATLLYCQALPISSLKAINHSSKKKKQIFLYSDTQKYYKAGAPVGSAGVYIGGRDIILVGMQFLGLKKLGSGYTLDRKNSNKTLPHEIVHMFTDRMYYAPGALGWFSEGLAEYVAITPYRGGKFLVGSNRKPIVEYVTSYGVDNKGGRAIGDEFDMIPLKEFMLMSYADFADFSSGKGGFNYGVGTLLVYYFFHFEDNGVENMTAFLKALRAGKRGEEALNSLLAGRTFEELEEDVHRAWRSRGVRINFASTK